MAATSVLTIMIQLAKKGDADRSTIKGLAGIKQAAGLAIGTFGALTGAALAVGAGMKKAFDIGKEGAQLELTRTRFDNLSRSINTTSDVLMGDLRTATRGLYSDSELAASAADLMGLGLAKTREEATRLASVSAALNMPMNQLVLTLTNMTTMRFDSLGVAVDGFQERLDGLEKQGLATGDAFKEAFLQQAEEQIGKVGHAADTNAGAFMRLDAAIKNVNDDLKIQMGQDLAPTAGALADMIEKSTDLSKNYNEVYAETNRLLQEGVASNQFEANALAIKNVQLKHLNDELTQAGRLEAEYGIQVRSATEATIENEAAIRAMTQANEGMISLMFNLQSETDNYNQKNDELKAKLIELQTEQAKYMEGGRKWKEIQGEIDATSASVDALAAEHEEASKRIAFSLLQQKMSADGLSDTEMQALMAMGVQWGILDEQVAASAINMDKQASAMAGSLGKPDSQLMDIIDKINNLARKSGSSFDFYVNIHTTGNLSGAPVNAVHIGNSPTGNTGRAAGGTFDPADMTVVGEGPSGWSPTAEVLFGNTVIPHPVAQWMKDAGMLNNVERAMYGSVQDLQEAQAVSTGNLIRRRRNRNRSGGSTAVAPVSSGGGGSSNDQAVTETVSTATEVSAEAVRSSVAVQQQATHEAIQTRKTIEQGNNNLLDALRENNELLRQQNATLQRSIVAAVQQVIP